MGDQMFLFIDIATLVMGALLIIMPGKVYNWGKKEHEKKEIPPKTKIGFIIFGVLVVLVGIFFVYNDLTGGA